MFCFFVAEQDLKTFTLQPVTFTCYYYIEYFGLYEISNSIPTALESLKKKGILWFDWFNFEVYAPLYNIVCPENELIFSNM